MKGLPEASNRREVFWLKLVQIPVFRTQVIDVRFDCERRAGDALDELVGGELGSMLVNVVFQPAMQSGEFSLLDFFRDAGLGF